MPDLKNRWPPLDSDELARTIEHLHRLTQVAGKYTLDRQFEPGWGNVVYNVTPRGLSTPTLRRAGVTFDVQYRLLDGDVIIQADTGTRTLRLTSGTVAGFYDEFVAAAAELGLPAPGSPLACEIPDASALDVDDEERPWDAAAARLAWAALDGVAGALETWQASYRGHRPRVGVMWGGFDLSATRYRAAAVDPPTDRPAFMQHGMSEEYVAVGFSFGSPEAPQPGVYAYIAPQPDGLEDRDWAVDGAAWKPEAGLVALPWEAVRATRDPHAAIVAFADAVYDAAVATAGWPPELVGPRFDGWHASQVPPGKRPTNEEAL
ncbi:MAG: hypothetical protein JWR63_1329 [Conexibacter sp.]|nr:hypothetical protein [Conexibacter sp.]